jgi:putative selenate reductase
VLEPVKGSTRAKPGSGFSIRERHQLAVLEAACNECSNCEVFCPEEGAPFRVKERVFLDRSDFDREGELDGFWQDGNTLHGRIGGEQFRADINEAQGRLVILGNGYRLDATWPRLEVAAVQFLSDRVTVDTAILWRLRAVWEGIYGSPNPNMVTAGGRA